MTVNDLLKIRQQQQQLTKPIFQKPSDVVSWLGAVQAQDFFGALWSVGQRMTKAVEKDVEAALNDRTIVRSWPMRGTLHFAPPQDLRWMLKFLTPRVIARCKGLYKQAELTKQVFSKSSGIFEKALQGGKQLTREELYAILEKNKIRTSNTRGLHILGHLAQQGLICFGSRKGKQQTFALLEEWIPSSKILPKEEALPNLALRYFTSHGPATIEDFAWWSGLTKTEALSALEDVKTTLHSATIDKKSFWFSTVENIRKSSVTKTYLLPTFDEYEIAYKDRSALIDPSDHSKIGGWATSSIVANGRIIGSWRRVLEKDTVTIETRSVKPFDERQKASIHQAAKRYSKFIGLNYDLNF